MATLVQKKKKDRKTSRMRLGVQWSGLTVLFIMVLAAAPPAFAQGVSKAFKGMDLIGEDSIANRPLLLMFAMAVLALVPFVGMMVTSFVKIAVVLSLTRQAIGTQQAPPTTVITGLAIILTVYVMQPVGLSIYNKTVNYMEEENADFFDAKNVDLLFNAATLAQEPLREFLLKNSHKKDRDMFYRVAYRLRAEEDRMDLGPKDFIIIIPAFVITELTRAFQIGFIIFIPFLVIDMVVSNILMALGMQMLSPTTISLPFKILLFVLVDGWYLITKGLVLGYQ
jgi:type III secretion protein R